MCEGVRLGEGQTQVRLQYQEASTQRVVATEGTKKAGTLDFLYLHPFLQKLMKNEAVMGDSINTLYFHLAFNRLLLVLEVKLFHINWERMTVKLCNFGYGCVQTSVFFKSYITRK